MRLRVWRIGVALALTLIAGRALAADALALLERAAAAASVLNYSGVYIYHHGEHAEVLRVLHRVDNNVEQERVDVLEGVPRKFYRLGNDIYCHMPGDRVRVERDAARRFFPAILPDKPQALLANYQPEILGAERVAGRDAIRVRLMPRDDYRHAVEIWIDRSTSLPLKARVVSRAGEIVSMFVFSEMQIGIAPDASLFVNDLRGKKVTRASLDETPPPIWQVTPPPGFSLMQVALRPLSNKKHAVTHLVYSDGLSNMSIFIEPVAEAGINFRGLSVEGAIAIYSRKVGDFKVTALGEVPSATLIVTGNSVRHK